MTAVNALYCRPKGLLRLVFATIVLSLWSDTVTEGAFLDEELPLRIVATTPWELLGDSPDWVQQIEGRQALTVVFSRPVIALGSDFGQVPSEELQAFTTDCGVPGRYRWVTTNIARFDPDVDWPPDLNCTFRWNQGLRTYDGAQLQAPPSLSVRLRTAPPNLMLRDVQSSSAMALTNNTWSATVGMADDALPEVPSDGNITLVFSYGVNISQLQGSFHLYQMQKSNRIRVPHTVLLSPCPPVQTPFFSRVGLGVRAVPVGVLENEADRCVVAKLQARLEPLGRYQLVLPPGSRYSSLAGPLSQELEVNINGLRAFRVPLLSDFSQDRPSENTWGKHVSYRRLSLWLVHGLDNGVRLDDLRQRLQICAVRASSCTPMAFNLSRVNLGTLVMTVPRLAPTTRYRVQVAASKAIKDGYGLPLRNSETTFWTNRVGPTWVGPWNSRQWMWSTDLSPVYLPVNASSDISWPYLSAGRVESLRVSYWVMDLDNPQQLGKVLEYLVHRPTVEQVMKDLGPPAGYMDRSTGEQPTLQFLNLTNGGSLEGGQAFLVADRRENVHTGAEVATTLVQKTQLQVSFIRYGSTCLFWVTRSLEKGGSVDQAEVTLYHLGSKQEPRGSSFSPTLLGSCTTAADGLCQIEVSKVAQPGSALAAIVRTRDASVLVPEMNTYEVLPVDQSAADENLHATLVVDRLLVKPGDDLHVTGYVLHKTKGGVPTNEVLQRLQLVLAGGGLWEINNEGEDSKSITVTPNISQEVGSFHAIIRVPEGIQMGMKQLQLVLNETSAGETANGAWQPPRQTVASTAITVGDPRPPTADLTLLVPKRVSSQGTVKVGVHAQSYVGTSVSGASVEVKWEVGDNTGNFTITTDATGKVEAEVDLKSLSLDQKDAMLQVTAQWMGPTREYIVKEAQVVVSDNSQKLTITRSLITDMPGYDFGVIVSVKDLDTGNDLTGVQVKVGLESDPQGSQECSAGAQSCVVTSGSRDFSQCQLRLPCMGNFLLRACVESGACHQDKVGRNKTDWSKNVWAEFARVPLWTDKDLYQVGEEVKLMFQNPWQVPGTSALLVWGNQRETFQKFISEVPTGLMTTSITVSEPCRGGCQALLLLSVPTSYGAGQPPVVPHSVLFDPLGAHTSVSEPLLLNISAEEPLVVNMEATTGQKAQVQNATDGNSRDVAVVAPGGQVNVSFTVEGKGSAGAEITLIAVDRAILDLVPYQLQDLPNLMRVSALLNYVATTMSDDQVKVEAIIAALQTKLRRLRIDPWLDVGNDLGGVLDVDIPDEEYFRNLVTPITHMPAQVWTPSRRPQVMESADSAFSMVSKNLPAAAPPSMAANMGPGAVPNTPTVRMQSRFQVTPVFTTVLTDEVGQANLTFTAPENLGTFVLRAYVAGPGGGRYGTKESEVMVRRQVSLTPSIPRFVRVGDAFEAGVVVALTSGAEPSDLTVKVSASLLAGPPNSTAPVSFNGTSPSQEIAFPSGQRQQEVRFRWTAAAVGQVEVLIEAEVLGDDNAKDALKMVLVVEGQQAPVHVATSFALAAQSSSGAQWQEGLDLPDAQPGSGHVNLSAGVGHLPVVETYYKPLKGRDLDYPEGYHSVAISVYPGFLSAYKKTTDAEGLGEDRDLVLTAIKSLAGNLTHPELGLLYVEPSRWPGYQPQQCNVYLNAWAVWAVQSVGAMQSVAEAQDKEYLKQWQSLPNTVDIWKKALTLQMVKEAEAARNGPHPHPLSAYDSIAWTRLAMGADWQPPVCDEEALPPPPSDSLTPSGEVPEVEATAPELEEPETGSKGTGEKPGEDLMLKPTVGAAGGGRQPLAVMVDMRSGGPSGWDPVTEEPGTGAKCLNAAHADDLSLERLIRERGNMSLDAKTAVALTLLAQPAGKDHEMVRQTVEEILGNMRVAGRTGYVSAGVGSPSAASTTTQALALLTLIGAHVENPLVDKLAQYLASGIVRRGPFSVSLADSEVVVVSVALVAYDRHTKSTDPDLRLKVTAAGHTLMEEEFTPSSTVGLVTSSTPLTDLIGVTSSKAANGSLPSIQFLAEGSGQVSLAVGLSFVPAKLLSFPTYRGMWVETAVLLDEGALVGPRGARVKTVPLGSLVTITVQVTSPDDLNNVMVEVLLPGGLEALDPNVFKGEDAQGTCGGDGGPMPRWIWPQCPQQETHTNRVVFTYPFFSAGMHSSSFKAVAASAGTFVVPPTKAYVAQQPEVMGLSPAGELKVCSTPCEVEIDEQGPGVPKGCPKNCNHQGVCDLSRGVCICDGGYSGDDCSVWGGY